MIVWFYGFFISEMYPAVMYRKPELLELNPEERDARTVVCMQLASRIRSEDLEEFFSSVGKVTSQIVIRCIQYLHIIQANPNWPMYILFNSILLHNSFVERDDPDI